MKSQIIEVDNLKKCLKSLTTNQVLEFGNKDLAIFGCGVTIRFMFAMACMQLGIHQVNINGQADSGQYFSQTYEIDKAYDYAMFLQKQCVCRIAESAKKKLESKGFVDPQWTMFEAETKDELKLINPTFYDYVKEHGIDITVQLALRGNMSKAHYL